MSSEFEAIKARLTAKKSTPIEPSVGLSTGSTLLNLACSGRADYGFLPGHYYLWVGDSGSGKTFITLTALAEAANDPTFVKHRLIFDQPERGALMDFERFFGGKMAARVEPPAGTRDKPRYSDTLESFYDNVVKAVEAGPCVYVLDSMDALQPSVDAEHARKARAARAKGKDDGAGSYGTAKAKLNSAGIREVHNALDKHGSILIIISQTRDNIGFDARFNPKTRGGGRALTFYASLELWTSVKGHEKTTYKDKPVEQGVTVKIRVKKGRLSGKDRTVEVPIFHSVGIDDTGSCISWLVEWGHWKAVKGRIDATEFNLFGTVDKLAQQIEKAGKVRQLRRLVGKVWEEIEASCMVKRQKRYD